MQSNSRSPDAPGRVAVPVGSSSYPGGKSGSGIYQRLINLIPRHRILIAAFAGKCGVTRRILPAEHTIVIDADADVCQWWDDWRRTKDGRALEIHHCDSIEWLRHRFGLTEYSDACSSDNGRSNPAGTQPYAAEAFVFCDPPYILSQRAHGRQYACELTDDDHNRLLRILTQIPATVAAVMLCGYASTLYATVDRDWRSIDHRVPTRGGLQDERIWMNYDHPRILHDYRYVGDCRRARERLRRRQQSWLSILDSMGADERAAMVDALSRPQSPSG